MTDNELIITLTVVAWFAYQMGKQQRQAQTAAAAPVDPMAWITGWPNA